MESAFRTTASALGVCAACYLLSTASWQQVLLLFMVAGFGWCWFSTFGGASGSCSRTPQSVPDQSGRASRQQASADSPDRAQKFAADSEITTVQAQSLPPKPRRQARSTSTAETTSTPASGHERVQKVYRFPMHQLSRQQALTPIIDCE